VPSCLWLWLLLLLRRPRRLLLPLRCLPRGGVLSCLVLLLLLLVCCGVAAVHGRRCVRCGAARQQPQQRAG
jgi:hypothetical protein